jgi:hypothetical protein
MEERAGDTGGDGDQVALSVEDFDPAGAGKFGEIDGASGADAGGGWVVGGDGGKLGQKSAGMDEEFFRCCRRPPGTHLDRVEIPRQSKWRDIFRGPCGTRGQECPRHVCEFVEGMGAGEGEFGDGGAAEGFEMRAATERLSHIVGD